MKSDNPSQISRAGFWRKLSIVTTVGLLTVFFLKPALFQYYELIYVAELIP